MPQQLARARERVVRRFISALASAGRACYVPGKLTRSLVEVFILWLALSPRGVDRQ